MKRLTGKDIVKFSLGYGPGELSRHCAIGWIMVGMGQSGMEWQVDKPEAVLREVDVLVSLHPWINDVESPVTIEDEETYGRAMRLAAWNNAYETDDQDIADVVNAYFEYKGLLEPLQAEVDTVIEDAESHAELSKELAVV